MLWSKGRLRCVLNGAEEETDDGIAKNGWGEETEVGKKRKLATRDYCPSVWNKHKNERETP